MLDTLKKIIIITWKDKVSDNLHFQEIFFIKNNLKDKNRACINTTIFDIIFGTRKF